MVRPTVRKVARSPACRSVPLNWRHLVRSDRTRDQFAGHSAVDRREVISRLSVGQLMCHRGKIRMGRDVGPRDGRGYCAGEEIVIVCVWAEDDMAVVVDGRDNWRFAAIDVAFRQS